MNMQEPRDMIVAQIDSNGKLLYADPAIRRLHIRAGGIDGGNIAIPSLANIAKLTHKLKIPLSRMVMVADSDFDIELWVDSKLEDDVAILSIIGWTEKHILQPYEPEGTSINSNKLGEDILFLTNAKHEIISFESGEKNVAAFGLFIGQNIFDILDMESDDLEKFKRDFDAHEQIENLIVKIKAWQKAYEFSAVVRYSAPNFAAPMKDDENLFLGYEIYISPIVNIFRDSDKPKDQQSSTIYQGLMATQIAPAIRQPLGRIIANADTIGSKLHGPIRENYANYARDIANAARHLIEIIDDLGDLEAIERPNFIIAQDDIELGDIAERLTGLLALKANEKSIIIETEKLKEPIYAIGEFRRVLQIGLNLLTNAVRYSPNDSKISISYGISDDMAYLSVKDEGPGIEHDMRDKIFEKFERLGQTGDGGSGLGLYISRRLAHAMKGDLRVDNLSQSGSCFRLILPQKPV